MKQTKLLRRIGVFEISRHEKEIICHLKDLMRKTCPTFMHYEDVSEHEPLDYLWQFYHEVECTFRFKLRQILINHNVAHLDPLVKKIGELRWFDIQFDETLDGKFYISFCCLDK